MLLKPNEYQDSILHFRRINRLVGVLIHHLPETKLRFNSDLTQIINDVIVKIRLIKNFLTQNQLDINAINEKDYPETAITNQDLLFAIHNVKHISREIDLILKTILATT